jgi:hypothetical protein
VRIVHEGERWRLEEEVENEMVETVKKSAIPNLERWLAKLSTTRSLRLHNRTLDFVKSCSVILDFQSVLISAQPCGDANVFSSSSYPLTRKSKSVKTDRINNKIRMLNSYELHSD